MEWIVTILVAAGIWSIIRANKKKEEGKVPIELSIETSFRSGRYNPEHIVDTGEVSQIDEGTFCINPKSPLPLTLKGASIHESKEIKKLLDDEARWQRTLSDITFLIAQKNIECIELEEFICQARSEVSSHIEKRKQRSEEWAKSSEKDKADLTREFQTAALENLSIRLPDARLLETLIFSDPGDVTVDDELLNIFSGNKKLYSFYVSNLGRSSRANQVPADDYYRKNWESLVDLGLAKRGKDIPITALLDNLNMKDINEYFSDRIDKKFTRKAKAIEFAASQPDVIDVLSRHISFREMFQILEPEGIEISSVRTCYEYAAAQAEVIRDTYVTSYRTLDVLEDVRAGEYDNWEIEAEDCCQQCSKLNGKKTRRKPAKLPPFHIGCTCSLNGQYD